MIVSRAKAEEAAGVLGVELSALTYVALRAAYRTAAKTCHPDHHAGKLQQWARVSWAEECLKHWIKSHPEEAAPTVLTNAGDCRVCSGTGRVTIAQRGFGKPLMVRCEYCRGTGYVEPEEIDSE